MSCFCARILYCIWARNQTCTDASAPTGDRLRFLYRDSDFFWGQIRLRFSNSRRLGIARFRAPPFKESFRPGFHKDFNNVRAILPKTKNAHLKMLSHVHHYLCTYTGPCFAIIFCVLYTMFARPWLSVNTRFARAPSFVNATFPCTVHLNVLRFLVIRSVLVTCYTCSC